MENIAELFNKLSHQKEPYKLIGEGSYSLVFDVGDVYKFTNEITVGKANETFVKVNRLNQKGVNVPRIYRIDNFKAEDSQVINNIKYMLHQGSNDAFDKVSAFVNKYNSNKGNCEYIGIYREKVEGKNLFDSKNYQFINLCKKNNIKNHQVLGKLKDNLEAEENKVLNIFLNMDNNHYTKFVDDGLEILNSGMVIDDILGTNFLYGKNGFVYIDLNGLENVSINGAKNVFDFTINPICESVFSGISNMNAEIYEKQLKLSQKIVNSLQKCVKSEQFILQFNEYMSKNNALKVLVDSSADYLGTKEAVKLKQTIYKDIEQIKDNNLAK